MTDRPTETAAAADALEEALDADADPHAEDAPLSARQAAFCEAYLRCASGAEAARVAGYRAAGAKTQAWRLLQDPRVRRRIDELRRAGELPAPRHALELLAKLERLYEGAAAAGKFREALAILDAQARLIREHRLDPGDAGATPAPGDDAADDAAAPTADHVDHSGDAETGSADPDVDPGGDESGGNPGCAAGDADFVDHVDPVDRSDDGDAGCDLFDQDLEDPDAGAPPAGPAETAPAPYDPGRHRVPPGPAVGNGVRELQQLMLLARLRIAQAISDDGEASRPPPLSGRRK